MTFEQLKAQLQGLINDKTSPQEAEEIGKSINALTELEGEANALLKSHEELRVKYVNAIKDNSFTQPPKQEDVKTPLTLEGAINNVIANRKK